VSQYPRRVLSTVQVYWPSSNTQFPLRVRAGTLIDCPPGSALETAYGDAGTLEDVVTLSGCGDDLDKSALTN
jgi:hypothetical protein